MHDFMSPISDVAESMTYATELLDSRKAVDQLGPVISGPVIQIEHYHVTVIVSMLL